MVNNLFERLVELPYMNLYSKILFAAIDLHIFDCLIEAKTSKQLANELKLHPKNCQYFLNALVSLELLEKSQDKFHNSDETTKYLTKGSSYYMGDVLRVSTKINDATQIDFKTLVINGPIGEIDASKISFDEMYCDMKDSQSGIRSAEIIDIVRSLNEYPNIKRILDLGCGAGLQGLSIIASREDITGVLFDRQPMGALINKCVDENGLKDRAEVKLGDFIEDDIGKGYDLVLAVGALNFAQFKISDVLKKIHESLNDEGVFIAVLDEVDLISLKPKEFVTSWLAYALNGMDIYMEKGFVKNEARKVGFVNIEENEKLLAFGHLNVAIFRK